MKMKRNKGAESSNEGEERTLKRNSGINQCRKIKRNEGNEEDKIKRSKEHGE